jgi:hypothetical protein
MLKAIKEFFFGTPVKTEAPKEVMAVSVADVPVTVAVEGAGAVTVPAKKKPTVKKATTQKPKAAKPATAKKKAPAKK